MKTNFYQQFLDQENKKLIDLSTGNPTEFESINKVNFKYLHTIKEGEINLSGYQEYFGTKKLINFLAEEFNKKFTLKNDGKNVLVTPGVQSALRYLHNVAKLQDKKILIPFGIEFPGAYPIEEKVLDQQILNYSIGKKRISLLI